MNSILKKIIIFLTIFISTKKNDWLDGTHVVFGNVVDGMNFIDYISELPTDEYDKPIGEVIIIDCGVL